MTLSDHARPMPVAPAQDPLPNRFERIFETATERCK